MKIGIIGVGIVGGACKFGFEKLGHNVRFFDKKFKEGEEGSDIEHVKDSEIVFICVPTPKSEDGSCNISIVEEVVQKLKQINYNNIVCIKSTISPGTTKMLSEKYNMDIAFVPEFLRERCAVTDFTENHDLCVIGTDKQYIYEKVRDAHGKFPKKFVHLTVEEAEMVKYFNNAFNAARVVFANSFYEVCKKKNINYTNVKNAAVNIHHIPDNYLDCNENFRGFAGMCLPKDVSELAVLEADTKSGFFRCLLEENDKYIKTVFDGMRKE